MPVEPSLCLTGLEDFGKDRVESVHVFGEANARLIVAAPEMYEALKNLTGWLDRTGGRHEPGLLMDHALAVLARAEGRDR